MFIQFKNKQGILVNIDTLAEPTFSYKNNHLIVFAKSEFAFKRLQELKTTDILITPTANPYLENTPFLPKTVEIR